MIEAMNCTGFLVLDGSYDDMTSEAFLFVRPMGTDSSFTTGAIVAGNKEIDSITGKVILGNYISDVHVSASPSLVKRKQLKHFSPYGDKYLQSSESLIILTGRYLGVIVDDDGDVAFSIDTIFPMKAYLDLSPKKLGKIGDWIDFEMQLRVLFDEVLTVDEWVRLYPGKP